MKKSTMMMWLVAFASLTSCKDGNNKPNITFTVNDSKEWKKEFTEKLSLLGHRNWIIVADKAFPQQTATGIEYMDTHEKIGPVLEVVLAELKKAGHVEPLIYQDKELQYLTDGQSKGIDAFKTGITKIIGATPAQTILHDSVFTKLDQSSKLFKVLVLKTDELLPYTSVFIQLNCAYWNGDSEKNLREKMGGNP